MLRCRIQYLIRGVALFFPLQVVDDKASPVDATFHRRPFRWPVFSFRKPSVSCFPNYLATVTRLQYDQGALHWLLPDHVVNFNKFHVIPSRNAILLKSEGSTDRWLGTIQRWINPISRKDSSLIEIQKFLSILSYLGLWGFTGCSVMLVSARCVNLPENRAVAGRRRRQWRLPAAATSAQGQWAERRFFDRLFDSANPALSKKTKPRRLLKGLTLFLTRLTDELLFSLWPRWY